MRCKQQRTKTALPNLPRRKSATLRKYAEKSMRFYQKIKTHTYVIHSGVYSVASQSNSNKYTAICQGNLISKKQKQMDFFVHLLYLSVSPRKRFVSWDGFFLFAVFMQVTIRIVRMYNSYGLQVGIDNDRAYEFHSPFLQIL